MTNRNFIQDLKNSMNRLKLQIKEAKKNNEPFEDIHRLELMLYNRIQFLKTKGVL